MEQASTKKDRFPIFRQRLGELMGDMTTTEFAEKVGLTRQTMGFYLNGDRIPDSFTLAQICEECNVSADWMIGLTNDPSRHPCAADEIGLSPKAIEHMKLIFNSPNRNDVLCALNPLLEKEFFFDLLGYIYAYSVIIDQEACRIKETIHNPESAYYGKQTESVILDSAMAAALQEEIQERYPITNGRVVVLCGENFIDYARLNIEHYFGEIIDDISGYKALQELKQKKGDDCAND